MGLVYQNETIESLFATDKLILNGNYSKSIKQLYLFGGFNFNWTSRQLNGIFIYEDDIDPSTGYQTPFVGLLNTIPANYICIDFGIAANYKNFVFGLSTMQINEPKQSFSGQTFARLQARLIGSLAYSKAITDDLRFGGQAYYQKQGKSEHLSVLANGQYKFAKMGLGIGYPLSSSAVGQKITAVMQAGVQFDKWSVAYNYDVWKPNSTTFNSHEISAAWFIKGLKKDSKTSDVLNALL